LVGAAAGAVARRGGLRPEAAPSAYRLLKGGAELQRDDARGKLLLTWSSWSWRLTAPLRALGRGLGLRRSR
ncbi:MAG: hypothetical protein ACHQJ5_09660, partial [Vicinamibacteria bacterium]